MPTLGLGGGIGGPARGRGGGLPARGQAGLARGDQAGDGEQTAGGWGGGRRCAAHGGEEVGGGRRLKKKLTCGLHMSVSWRERNSRGILGHTKIRGSASGSRSVKDV